MNRKEFPNGLVSAFGNQQKAINELSHFEGNGSSQIDPFNSDVDGKELHEIIDTLKRMIPLEYASDWDNVGLLIEPSGVVFVEKILMTIDLTEQVLDEAISKGVHMIFSYHPPLFRFVSLFKNTSF